MRIRVVVADQSEARYYSLERLGGPLRLVGRTLDPQARLHERDLVSDRPGRIFNSARLSGKRRGSVAHHGTGGEKSARKTEAERFARRITGELDAERREGSYDRLVLMCPPGFLGLLRGTMTKSLHKSVVVEVAKDLVRCSDKVIGSHVPADAFELLSS